MLSSDEFSLIESASQVPTLNPPEAKSKIYILELAQEPIQARMCGFGDSDRRVIDPVPVVELFVLTSSGLKERPLEGSLDANVVVHVGLRTENFEIPETNQFLPNLLVGNLTSSCVFLSEISDSFAENILNPQSPRCLFVFTDLSIRSFGKYTLSFSLIFFSL
ncbi:hypothetical protein HK096_008953, partial [Nowakowskiella sp. JEL0078]